MDGRRIGRCVALHDDYRIFRDRVLAAKGKRRRDRVPRALSMVVARGESRGGFLGRRSRRVLLDRERSSVPLRQMTEVLPYMTNLHAVPTCIHSITCDPRANFDRSNSSPIPACGPATAENGPMSWMVWRADGGCLFPLVMRKSMAGGRNDALRRGREASISKAPRGTSPSFHIRRSMKNATDLGQHIRAR